MNFKHALAAAAAALSLGAANAGVITFAADAAGSKPNGFSAVGHAGVTFTDTLGANLSLETFTIETAGTQALVVFGDDTSALRINFADRQTALSMSYGNDDSAYTGQTVFALLSLFDGGVLVGSTLVETAGNDLMDAVISASFAGGFDSATFAYTNASGALINLIEVVDNITYTPAGAVPLPGSLALSGLALLGLAAASRRRA